MLAPKNTLWYKPRPLKSISHYRWLWPLPSRCCDWFQSGVHSQLMFFCFQCSVSLLCSVLASLFQYIDIFQYIQYALGSLLIPKTQYDHTEKKIYPYQYIRNVCNFCLKIIKIIANQFIGDLLIILTLNELLPSPGIIY